MADCCTYSGNPSSELLCPFCNTKGKPVQIVTLKSLLLPDALERLKPDTAYNFCASSNCEVVYFNNHHNVFNTRDLKVPVFQKDNRPDTPVCYCFGWTYERIVKTGKHTVASNISEHVRANRCGCEVNNPQGSCCLGNVSTFSGPC